MVLRIILSISFMVFSFASCSTEEYSTVPDPLKPPSLSDAAKEAAAYEVYSAVLISEFPKGKVGVIDHTSIAPISNPYDLYDGNASNVSLELIASYEEENKSSLHLVQSSLLDSDRYPIVSDESQFPASNPNTQPEIASGTTGSLRFSRVGFNSQMDRALVSSSYICGSLCGNGKFYFLVKTENGWTVLWTEELWVS